YVESAVVIEIAHADAFAAEGAVKRRFLKANFGRLAVGRWLGGWIGTRWNRRGDEGQLEILEPHFRSVAGVKLQAHEPAAGGLGIIAIDAQVAVEPRSHAAANGDDLVAVPVAFLDELLSSFGFKECSAVLFVELAPPAGTNVALIAAHEAVLDRLAANLNAAMAFVVDELDVELQSEVAHRQ